MKEFRVGIIGTGMISHLHMKVYKSIPGMKVVAAAENDAGRLEAFGAQYGIKNLYTDFRELLKLDDIDAVDVCVHNNLHAPISIAVMKAGKACYCEKPMAASYADSKLMYDCAKKTGVKFAIQIASIFTLQAKIARQMVREGDLGEVYHAKAAGAYYRQRFSIDIAGFPPSFMTREIAGHGQMVDIGVYEFSRMLFVLGLPELKSVYGKIYQKIANPYKDRVIEVEDMGVGMAEFSDGLTLEVIQSSATNMENVGPSYVTGTKGALEFICLAAGGSPFYFDNNNIPDFLRTQLRFTGEHKGVHVNAEIKTHDTQLLQQTYNPESLMWFDNQLHWYKYLCGELTDETRYDTPLIALNASLLTDGFFISSEEGRSVTADEIKEKSKSLAVWKQETPLGVFDYESTF
jgi:predicted dehydrogenase